MMKADISSNYRYEKFKGVTEIRKPKITFFLERICENSFDA